MKRITCIFILGIMLSTSSACGSAAVATAQAATSDYYIHATGNMAAGLVVETSGVGLTSYANVDATLYHREPGSEDRVVVQWSHEQTGMGPSGYEVRTEGGVRLVRMTCGEVEARWPVLGRCPAPMKTAGKSGETAGKPGALDHAEDVIWSEHGLPIGSPGN